MKSLKPIAHINKVCIFAKWYNSVPHNLNTIIMSKEKVLKTVKLFADVLIGTLIVLTTLTMFVLSIYFNANGNITLASLLLVFCFAIPTTYYILDKNN